MVDLVLSLVAALGLAAGGLLGLGLLTVLPLVVALGLAERRGADVARWGAISCGCVLGGLGVALLGARAGAPPAAVAVAVAATWLGPALLLAVGRLAPRLAGRGGRHE